MRHLKLTIKFKDIKDFVQLFKDIDNKEIYRSDKPQLNLFNGSVKISCYISEKHDNLLLDFFYNA